MQSERQGLEGTAGRHSVSVRQRHLVCTLRCAAPPCAAACLQVLAAPAQLHQLVHIRLRVGQPVDEHVADLPRRVGCRVGGEAGAGQVARRAQGRQRHNDPARYLGFMLLLMHPDPPSPSPRPAAPQTWQRSTARSRQLTQYLTPRASSSSQNLSAPPMWCPVRARYLSGSGLQAVGGGGVGCGTLRGGCGRHGGLAVVGGVQLAPRPPGPQVISIYVGLRDRQEAQAG